MKSFVKISLALQNVLVGRRLKRLISQKPHKLTKLKYGSPEEAANKKRQSFA